jgi:hypothetical protein
VRAKNPKALSRLWGPKASSSCLPAQRAHAGRRPGRLPATGGEVVEADNFRSIALASGFTASAASTLSAPERQRAPLARCHRRRQPAGRHGLIANTARGLVVSTGCGHAASSFQRRSLAATEAVIGGIHCSRPRRTLGGPPPAGTRAHVLMGLHRCSRLRSLAGLTCATLYWRVGARYSGYGWRREPSRVEPPSAFCCNAILIGSH